MNPRNCVTWWELFLIFLDHHPVVGVMLLATAWSVLRGGSFVAGIILRTFIREWWRDRRARRG